jgi:hypothetical protein
MGAKALILIGGAAAAVGIAALLLRTKAYAAMQVSIISNPIPTKLMIDGKLVDTPATVALAPGVHSFAAVPQSPDITVTWGFDRWTINGKTVSYAALTSLNITEPCTIKAEYTIAQSGRYPLVLT